MRVALVTNEVARRRVGVADEAEAPTRRAELLFAPSARHDADARLGALLAYRRVAATGRFDRRRPLGLDTWDVKVRSEFMATPGAFVAGAAHQIRDGGRGSHDLRLDGSVKAAFPD